MFVKKFCVPIRRQATAQRNLGTSTKRQNPYLHSQIGVSELNLDDDLLSHGEAPHYHRRCIVSLLSSGWDQVVPMLYGRQEILCAKSSFDASANRVCDICGLHELSVHCVFTTTIRLTHKLLGCYMVKPHGQLVLVSSTPHSAYTPNLSTS